MFTQLHQKQPLCDTCQMADINRVYVTDRHRVYQESAALKLQVDQPRPFQEKGVLLVPRVRTKLGEAAFQFYTEKSGIVCDDIKQAPTLTMFKSRLKTFLFCTLLFIFLTLVFFN